MKKAFISKIKAFFFVHPKGFEPLSLVPETNILSIELRVPEAAKVKNPVNHFAGYTLLHSLSFIHEKF